MAQRLFKSRFISPYNKNGGTNVGFCKGHAGVYMIADEAGKVVYIGFSASNLYKTVLRHFQSWDDKRQVRVSYKYRHEFKVRIIITTPARAEKLEAALIVKMKPKDNPDKLKKYVLSAGEKDIYEEFEHSKVKSIEEMEEAPF